MNKTDKANGTNKPDGWRRTAKGVWWDRYHPPIYRPRGEGVNKRVRKH